MIDNSNQEIVYVVENNSWEKKDLSEVKMGDIFELYTSDMLFLGLYKALKDPEKIAYKVYTVEVEGLYDR
jgi:hypothetical protein